MPVYECKCNVCGEHKDVFLKLSEYKNLPDCCGEQMQRVISAPFVATDIVPYRSPIDGTIVKSRSDHKAHMRKHGVIEVGNEKLTRPMTKQVDEKKHSEDLKRDIAATLSGFGI